ncbi:SAM-dependent methyltransferase [Nocardia transvalensis]|uniref:SAM-dependent methyltransferase n=1 Tax=Nocardia transvalensis TaxID=37333 RepID=UPI0018937D1C|nr:SAM-dependent methyltransferase [Nocardia transvalensis]MBF6327779.1 SAM-dependent methyltransferase [Nocardia transvalensis]
MTTPSLPQALSGPPLTAIGVAVIRARETERPDRLYADPLAQAFVDAAESAYLSPDAPPGSADTWAAMLGLVDALYDSRTLAVRMVDDDLLAAADAGIEQIVLLGAGLDTHAFRLDWPTPVRLFEVDLPPMFEFKEAVLAGQHAEPSCERIVVPADLREEWGSDLLDRGFRRDIPTTWVDHVTNFLPRDDARRAVVTITELSAPGSGFGFPVTARPSFARTLGAVPGLDCITGGPDAATAEHGIGPDGQEWLESLGWATTFVCFADMVAHYGRDLPAPIDPGTGNVVAVRR